MILNLPPTLASTGAELVLSYLLHVYCRPTRCFSHPVFEGVFGFRNVRDPASASKIQFLDPYRKSAPIARAKNPPCLGQGRGMPSDPAGALGHLGLGSLHGGSWRQMTGDKGRSPVTRFRCGLDVNIHSCNAMHR
jgi:hypothetical protein